MNLDRGFISPYFATSSEDMICELDSPCILLTTKKLLTSAKFSTLLKVRLKPDVHYSSWLMMLKERHFQY